MQGIGGFRSAVAVLAMLSCLPALFAQPTHPGGAVALLAADDGVGQLKPIKEPDRSGGERPQEMRPVDPNSVPPPQPAPPGRLWRSSATR